MWMDLRLIATTEKNAKAIGFLKASSQPLPFVKQNSLLTVRYFGFVKTNAKVL